jgi:hypothetical protein
MINMEGGSSWQDQVTIEKAKKILIHGRITHHTS